MPNKKLIIIVFVLLTLFLGLNKSVFAGTVRIDQPKIRLSIPPGQAKTGSIKVENLSAQPLEVKVYLEDWFYLPACDGTKEFKPAGALPLSAAKWVTFAPAEFSIPAYGRKTVNFTVNVPGDASGGHYAVMFFETFLGQQQQAEGVAVNVMGRIGSLFYIEPEGTIKKSCRIEKFSLGRLSRNEPLEISADFKNDGNADITAKGNYYIIDQEGIVYARGEFKDIYTLPNDKGTIKSSWNKDIPSGSYDMVLTWDLGGKLSLVKEAHLKVGNRGEIVYVGSLK